jgi:hypothetical protein
MRLICITVGIEEPESNRNTIEYHVTRCGGSRTRVAGSGGQTSNMHIPEYRTSGVWGMNFLISTWALLLIILRWVSRRKSSSLDDWFAVVRSIVSSWWSLVYGTVFFTNTRESFKSFRRHLSVKLLFRNKQAVFRRTCTYSTFKHSWLRL